MNVFFAFKGMQQSEGNVSDVVDMNLPVVHN